MWVIVMALASCQNAAEDPGPGEPVADSSGYPSLHTVPPRPRLSYTIEQRRTVMDGLIADRENARYSDQVVRYRTGLSGLPPPDAPPVAAAPPDVAPDEPNAGDISPPPDAVRERRLVGPETDAIYEDDDDFDSFLGDLAGGRNEQPVEMAPGPESNAAPLAPAIVRAGAARPVSAPAAHDDGRPPGVVWAIPVETAGVSDARRPSAAPASGNHEATSPPPPAGPATAGRAPGVVWGMVDRSDGPAATAAVETPDGIGQRPQPAETVAAGRAPGVVWGMVDRPDGPAGPPAAAASGAPAADTTVARAAAPVPRTPAAGPPTNDQNGTSDRHENGAEPAVAAVAERPDALPPSEADVAAIGIEVGDGLIALAPASGAGPASAEESIAFAPGAATLPPDAAARLKRFLAEVKAPGARIKVVGEGETPALALDRALAVGVALVQRGVPADRLELIMGRGAAGDQARLSVAPSAP